ncbi:MAG: ATP-binding protein [Candidatus Margulisiibacteriota bacterium]|nr:ATP-binding protein [Candidatus Margulisiibacteriota bacterium]
MFKTLKSVLFITFIGLVILVLLIFAILATPRIRAAAINQISSELFKQIALEEGKYTDILEKRLNSSVLQKNVITTGKLSGGRVTIIAKDGKVLADSATPFAKISELENHADRPEVVQAEREGRGRSIRFSATLGKNLIYVAVPIKDLGYLRLSIPATYATDLVINIQKSMAVAFAAALITAIILSMMFSRWFADPIIRLSEISKKIADGKYPQTIVRKSGFEIGKLEESIEQMSYRLAGAFRDLKMEQGQIITILSSMSEGVLAVGSDGKLIIANPVIEKMFEVIEPEIVGKRVREGIRNNEIADLIEETLKTSRAVNREINLISPEERSVVAHASPIRTDEGDLLGVVCVLYDVTEMRRLEQYRSEFVANVSHELKTPLTSIRNYVETLINGGIEDKKNNMQFLQKIDKHAINLSALIDDILEISRLESKRGLGPFVKIDIGKIVNRTVETVSEKAKKKRVELVVNCKINGCFISGIEDHVYRAVLNLLDNAINYTDAGGKVEVSCRRDGETIKIVVLDTGIGIPKEHQSRIFERFYRIDKVRSRDEGGTGLGLSIVKHVVNIHNGTILVESDINMGSKFTLTFSLPA